MKLSTVIFMLLILPGIEGKAQTKRWVALLDQNLSKWEKFMGVPHTSLELTGYPKGDGMKGIPLGLNNDPLNVFSTVIENDETILKITGQMYGGLTTKASYSNFHLKFQVKWGEKKYEPRLTQKRDNGVLYHCTGPHGKFWNVWMRSQEMQVQEGDMGDYFGLAGAKSSVTVIKTADKAWQYSLKAPSVELTYARQNGGVEKPNGEWNSLELICIGDKSIHVVNGKVVNVLTGGRITESGNDIPLSSGKIQIQSEGAEAYYKNIQIRSVKKFPSTYLKQMK
ncbi:MAG: DUF1080 domain-containing protein [Sphingobacteriaceae bacterium]|nr:DUF1080 domain-containing protein [Sphingobacteriaceae bacterium]